MEKKKNGKKKSNRGLVVFTCLALLLAIGLGAVVYLPKLLEKKNNNGEPVDVTATDTPAPQVTDQSGTPIIVTAIPSMDPENTESTVVASGKGIVSCSNPLASAIGAQILDQGGNAVDAIIAMAFALGVLEPYASGIGGGGCAMVYDPVSGASMCYDYRDAAGDYVFSSTSLGATGVPGFVLGMETLSQKYGSMSWGSLIQPSIEYAENGFSISASFARHLQSSRSKLSSKKSPQFYNGSNLLVEGDVVYQSELAETYRLLQRYGSTIFYHGAITDHMIDALSDRLTSEDFSAYSVRERKPVQGTFREYTIVSAPAPFSGTTLIQMLNIADAVDLISYDDDVVRYANLMANIASVTLKDRRKNICDPDYHPVPSNLLTADHINALIEKVKNGSPEYVEPDDEHESTTHIAVIDGNGMMATMTNTLSDFFGYGVYVDGFFMNNTLTTTSYDPSARNYCIKGQRPRSFAMPTFIFGPDGFKMALGSSGGDRIPQVVTQILLRYFNGEDLQEACDKPRLYLNGYEYRIEDASVIDPNNLLPGAGFYKRAFPTREFFGAFNAVYYKNGVTGGASDGRRYGGIATSEGDDLPDS
jgi:gamma-glutamyltranspeptidase/glutathione hydrolase